MKEKKRREGLFQRLGRQIAEETGTFLGDPHIELCGRGRLTVGGAKKIGSFSPEKIRILLSKETLTVTGISLICLSFQNETLVIGGRILSVTFGEGGEI